jgi:hypothetical protein
MISLKLEGYGSHRVTLLQAERARESTNHVFGVEMKYVFLKLQERDLFVNLTAYATERERCPKFARPGLSAA